MSYRASMFTFMAMAAAMNNGGGSEKNKHDQTHHNKKWNRFKPSNTVKRARNQQRSNRHIYTNKDMRM